MKRTYADEGYYLGGPAALEHGLVGVPLKYDIEKLKDFFRQYYTISHNFKQLDDGEYDFAIEYDNDGEIRETTAYMPVSADRAIIFDDFSTYAFVLFIRRFHATFPENTHFATSVQDLHSKPIDLSLDDKAMMDKIEEYYF